MHPQDPAQGHLDCRQEDLNSPSSLLPDLTALPQGDSPYHKRLLGLGPPQLSVSSTLLRKASPAKDRGLGHAPILCQGPRSAGLL